MTFAIRFDHDDGRVFYWADGAWVRGSRLEGEVARFATEREAEQVRATFTENKRVRTSVEPFSI